MDDIQLMLATFKLKKFESIVYSSGSSQQEKNNIRLEAFIIVCKD